MRRSNDPPPFFCCRTHFPFGLFFSSFVLSSFLQYLYIANSNRPVGPSAGRPVGREMTTEKEIKKRNRVELRQQKRRRPIVFVEAVNADATRALLAES